MRTVLQVGTVLHFKRSKPYLIERYGSTAVIVGRSTSMDQPHPGHIFHDHIALVTSNGTEVEWSPSTVRAEFQMPKGRS